MQLALGPEDGEPGSQHPELEKIAQAVRSRISPRIMRATISALCDVEPMTLSQLATWLGRSEAYLQNHHLREIIQDRTLCFLHSTPTHPRQRTGII